jgi:acetoin utilization protein AcuB
MDEFVTLIGEAIVDHVEHKQRQIADTLDELRQQRRIGEILVSHVMTPSPDCVMVDDSLMDVVRLFHKRGFRHPLVINEQGKLVGVISDRDIFRSLAGSRIGEQEHLAQTKAGEVMSTDLVTTEPLMPLADAVHFIVLHGINCLPVVANDRLVGILTTTDLYLTLQNLLLAERRGTRNPLASTT